MSQACTKYIIARIDREWWFIKKFSGSQLRDIVLNRIILVLRCTPNCHTRGATSATQSRLFRLLSCQPTSFSSRCNKLFPFCGSYIYLIFFVQLTSSESPITTGSGSTPPKYLKDYSLSSFLGLCELWDNLLLNVDGAVDISRILLLVCLFKKGDAPVGVVRRAGAFFFVVVLSCSCWPYYFNWIVAIKP